MDVWTYYMFDGHVDKYVFVDCLMDLLMDGCWWICGWCMLMNILCSCMWNERIIGGNSGFLNRGLFDWINNAHWYIWSIEHQNTYSWFAIYTTIKKGPITWTNDVWVDTFSCAILCYLLTWLSKWPVFNKGPIAFIRLIGTDRQIEIEPSI